MIAYFDYRPGYESQREEFDEAIARVLASGKLILGEEVEAFEEEFARFIGVQHAIGVGNGNRCHHVVPARTGARAGRRDPDRRECRRRADCGDSRRRSHAEASRRASRDLASGPRSSRKGAHRKKPVPSCRFTSMETRPNSMHFPSSRSATSCLSSRIVRRAHGARFRGRPVGSRGAVGCFSFYPTKNIGAFGDGGICVNR